jgi:hypothetical protein
VGRHSLSSIVRFWGRVDVSARHRTAAIETGANEADRSTRLKLGHVTLTADAGNPSAESVCERAHSRPVEISRLVMVVDKFAPC